MIIKSEANCCQLTGCVLDVQEDYVVLLDNNTSRRCWVVIDCICAMKVPPEELPPLPEICECQIQGLGSILAITLPPIPPIIEYTLINLNICPNCTPENSSLEYVYTLFIPNQPLVIIFLELEEITTVDCENEEEATIEGTGLVNEEDCEFTLEVSEEGPGSFIMDMTITCGGEIIHEREAELEGTINITEC